MTADKFIAYVEMKENRVQKGGLMFWMHELESTSKENAIDEIKEHLLYGGWGINEDEDLTDYYEIEDGLDQESVTLYLVQDEINIDLEEWEKELDKEVEKLIKQKERSKREKMYNDLKMEFENGSS